MPKQGGGVLSSLGEVVWRGGANFKGLYMRLGGQKLHLTEKFGHVTGHSPSLSYQGFFIFLFNG